MSAPITRATATIAEEIPVAIPIRTTTVAAATTLATATIAEEIPIAEAVVIPEALAVSVPIAVTNSNHAPLEYHYNIENNNDHEKKVNKDIKITKIPKTIKALVNFFNHFNNQEINTNKFKIKKTINKIFYTK